MKRTASLPATLCAALILPLAAPGPVLAHDPEPGPDARGERLLPDGEELRELGDLAERMLRRFGERMEPMAERLRALVDDLDAYEAPEKLPNGDIIIRRKPDAPARGTEEGEDGVAL